MFNRRHQPLKQYCMNGHDRMAPGALLSDGHCRECTLRNARVRYRSKKYGLSQARYDEMLAKQGGVCALCKGHSNSNRLVVDHDHETGVIRGLLCDDCNKGLGLLQDSRQLVIEASSYLSTGARLEVVYWLDADFRTDEGEAGFSKPVQTVGYVTRDGRWLRVASERILDTGEERAITRIPIELVVQRIPLVDGTPEDAAPDEDAQGDTKAVGPTSPDYHAFKQVIGQQVADVALRVGTIENSRANTPGDGPALHDGSLTEP